MLGAGESAFCVFFGGYWMLFVVLVCVIYLFIYWCVYSGVFSFFFKRVGFCKSNLRFAEP